jgi:hypothetical protein
MILIAAAAFDAMLPGSVGFEPEPDVNGHRSFVRMQSDVRRGFGRLVPSASFSCAHFG